MLPDPRVQEALKTFVCVEWRYDGKGGKVTRWTREHGDPDPAEPCILGWILDKDEKELAGPGDGFFRDPAGLAARLIEAARAWEGPGIPFALLEVEDGTAPALEEARAGGEPALLYFREEDGPDEKARARQAKACQPIEKALASKKVERLARRFRCIKADLSDPEVLAFAKAMGISSPGILLLPPGDGKPRPCEPSAEKLAAGMEAVLDALAPAPAKP